MVPQEEEKILRICVLIAQEEDSSLSLEVAQHPKVQSYFQQVECLSDDACELLEAIIMPSAEEKAAS